MPSVSLAPKRLQLHRRANRLWCCYFETERRKGAAYFADGIQDEILTKLASIADLKVISRTSTAKYKSKPEDLKTVSQQLGVATVLEGSVQKAADKIVSTFNSSTPGLTHTYGPRPTIVTSKMSLPWRAKWRRKSPIHFRRNCPAEANTTRHRADQGHGSVRSLSERRVPASCGECFLEAGVIRPGYRVVSASDRARSNFALAMARLAESRSSQHWFVEIFH